MVTGAAAARRRLHVVGQAAPSILVRLGVRVRLVLAMFESAAGDEEARKARASQGVFHE